MDDDYSGFSGGFDSGYVDGMDPGYIGDMLMDSSPDPMSMFAQGDDDTGWAKDPWGEGEQGMEEVPLFPENNRTDMEEVFSDKDEYVDAPTEILAEKQSDSVKKPSAKDLKNEQKPAGEQKKRGKRGRKGRFPDMGEEKEETKREGVDTARDEENVRKPVRTESVQDKRKGKPSSEKEEEDQKQETAEQEIVSSDEKEGKETKEKVSGQETLNEDDSVQKEDPSPVSDEEIQEIPVTDEEDGEEPDEPLQEEESFSAEEEQEYQNFRLFKGVSSDLSENDKSLRENLHDFASKIKPFQKKKKPLSPMQKMLRLILTPVLIFVILYAVLAFMPKKSTDDDLAHITFNENESTDDWDQETIDP